MMFGWPKRKLGRFTVSYDPLTRVFDADCSICKHGFMFTELPRKANQKGMKKDDFVLWQCEMAHQEMVCPANKRKAIHFWRRPPLGGGGFVCFECAKCGHTQATQIRDDEVRAAKISMKLWLEHKCSTEMRRQNPIPDLPRISVNVGRE